MPRGGSGDPLGKLKAAARRWAGGRGGKPVQVDDALTAAAPLPERAEAAGDAPIELTAPEAEPVGLFLALDTQWRWHAMVGMRIGLDYAQIAPVATMMEITLRPELFTDLKMMEAEALRVWAARR